MDIQAVKTELATEYGLPIIGTGDYFSTKDAGDKTEALVSLYELVKGMVREHDKLADATGNGNFRINGKRGRKAEVESVTTVDDVLARLAG